MNKCFSQAVCGSEQLLVIPLIMTEVVKKEELEDEKNEAKPKTSKDLIWDFFQKANDSA